MSAEEFRAAVGDLEQAARAAAFAALAQAGPDSNEDVSPAAEPAGLPLPVRQFLAGLGFLRDHLWSGAEAGPPGLAGFLLHEGRLWALRAGIETRLDQMTGAPARVPWHETADGASLAWGEADAREVWRLECAGPAGVLAAHARPALASVLGTMRDEAMSDSSSPLGPALEVVPAKPPATRASRAAARPAVAAARVWRWTPRLALGVAACVAVLALAALGIWAREPMSRALVGRYDLALVTRPAGATVRVDGKLVAGRTPLTLPLEPGEHRVELDYGEYAHAVITVEGGRDETVRREFAWMGSLAVSSADTTARLRVAFDGQALGALPLWRDEVPVGRHRLSFQGQGIRPWEEDVKIKVGQSTRVLAEPVRVPDYGLVTARAERVSSDGVEDVEGASVFVDGKAAGATPLDLRLTPGPHSVRIASGPELGPVHLIDVQPGGRFFASTTFGRPAEPAVVFEAPRTIG
ncbi:MAG: PEGA domain-containing protein, partial [Candidatus Eisenbacteria bacterium]